MTNYYTGEGMNVFPELGIHWLSMYAYVCTCILIMPVFIAFDCSPHIKFSNDISPCIVAALVYAPIL